MKFLYFDTSVIRTFSDRPEVWDKLHGQFIRTFGRSYRHVQSYYLFFEYIGFTKTHLAIPEKFKTPDLPDSDKLAKIAPHLQKESEEYRNILDESMCKLSDEMFFFTLEKLLALRETFEELIEKRKERISTYPVAQMLVNMLFDNVFLLVENDFEQFVKHAARHLTWDMFCSIHPHGLSLKAIREWQLDFWFQFWETGTLLPFGKIIDDQSKDYKMDFTSPFKNFEDMVDSELHTYLALGYKTALGYKDDGQARSIYGLLHLPKDPFALSKRHELALRVVNNIQKTLRGKFDTCLGKLYSLDEKTHDIKEVNESVSEINLSL